jgi:hypothetical protein
MTKALSVRLMAIAGEGEASLLGTTMLVECLRLCLAGLGAYGAMLAKSPEGFWPDALREFTALGDWAFVFL